MFSMLPREILSSHYFFFTSDNMLYWILGTIVTLIFCKYAFQTRKRLPPGPWGAPLVGHLPLLGNKPHITIEKWSRRYGDLMMLRFGSRNVLIVSGLSSLKTCLLDKWQDFGSRPNFLALKSMSDGRTIIGREMTPEWKHLRKVMKGAVNLVLKKEAGSVSFLEEHVIITACELCEDLINKGEELDCKASVRNNEFRDFTQKTDVSFDPREILFDKMAHLLFCLCFGSANRTFGDLQEFKQVQKRIVKAFNGLDVQDIFPWLKNFYTPDTSGIRNDVKYQDDIVLRHQEIYEQHHSDTDKKALRDFMGNLIKYIHENSDKGSKSQITNEEIKGMPIEFIGAGLFTSNGWLSWFIYFIARYPHIQERAFEEVSRNIDKTQTVSSNDRQHLPFTEAVLWESFRYATALPLLIPHAAKTDTSIDGYDIPKGTVMFINAWALSRDSRLWTDPHKFIPERFLIEEKANNQQGPLPKLQNNFNDTNSEHSNGTNVFRIRREKVDQVQHIAFGLGARKCVGEQIGKMLVFLIAATIVQRCEIIMTKGLSEKEETKSLGAETPPFEIIVKKRV